MAYTPKTWRDYPSTETMVMASDLNRIEKGIDDAHKDLEKKIDTPETTGTADQVLTLGADGKPVWSDPSAEITVDDALSDTSENPVQNKVIKAEIDKKANTDDVPAEVTEQTITNWGFTKNTGTYSKPDDGIPKTDLASAVQTSLSMADKIVYGYDDGRIYAVGELVFYNNWIYQCIESCMGVLPTNTTYWKGYANIAAVISELNSNLTQKFTTIDCGKFNSSETQTFAIGKSPKKYAIIGYVIDYGDNVNYEMYGCTDNILIIRLNIDGSLYIRKKQSATYNNYNLKVVLMKL